MSERQTLLKPVNVLTTSTDFDIDKINYARTIIRLHNEINEDIKLVLERTKLCFEKILQIGGLLIEQKEELKHGQFGQWVQRNLPFSQRTVNRYMEIYRRRNELKLDNVTNLNQAYKSLRMLSCQEKPALDWESNSRKKIIIFPDTNEIEFINEALTKVKKLLDTTSVTRAIYFLSSDWLEQNDNEIELPPLEEKIQVLEKIYDVKIEVHARL